MAAATAAAPATAGSGMKRTHSTPTKAESVLQATTDQGCASGLAGTANTSTALAPSGATSQALAGELAHRRHNTAAVRMPSAAPAIDRQRSDALTASGAGRNPLSQVERLVSQAGLRAAAGDCSSDCTMSANE